MIPEWVSFRNEFRSRMKFVLHSHDKIDRLSHLENDRFVLHFENDTRAPLAPDYTFSSRNGVSFQFTWYQNEISYQNENFIRIENRNELIPEWLVRGRNFVSVSCKQIQRNLWGWNELVLEWKLFRYHVNQPLNAYGNAKTNGMAYSAATRTGPLGRKPTNRNANWEQKKATFFRNLANNVEGSRQDIFK